MQIGQIVRIKSEWLGNEDADALYVVRTCDEPGKPRVDISAIDLIEWPLWPMELVTLDMIEATSITVDMAQ